MRIRKKITETLSRDEIENHSDNFLNPILNKPKTNFQPIENPIKILKEKIDNFKNQILNIEYQDIDFLLTPQKYLGIFDNYEIQLTEELDQEKNEIITLLEQNNFPENILDSWNFSIQCEGKQHYNKIHFGFALPYELRGTGFGYKIYKSFLIIKGFGSMSFQSTDLAKNIWVKLAQDIHFETVVGKDESLIVNKKLNGKINLVNSFMQEYDLNTTNALISPSLLREIQPNYVGQVAESDIKRMLRESIFKNDGSFRDDINDKFLKWKKEFPAWVKTKNIHNVNEEIISQYLYENDPEMDRNYYIKKLYEIIK